MALCLLTLGFDIALHLKKKTFVLENRPFLSNYKEIQTKSPLVESEKEEKKQKLAQNDGR